MKVAVFGASGFIGKHLVAALEAKKWEALPLDIRKTADWEQKLKDADAVINLAGHPLFKERWDTRIKALIHDSRVEGTEKIVAALGPKTKVFVNASAIGIYGTGEEEKDEHSFLANDFLARVCRDWEDAAKVAERAKKIRTVIIRFGIVLGKEGGALANLLLPFKLGVGGPIGSGKQSMSWIHVDDAASLLVFAIENEKAPPIMNATAPEILSNKEFSKTLGKVLHRPAFLPVPKLGLYALVGEAAGVIASGQRVHPKATQESGYTFKFPKLEAALKNILD